MKGAKTGINAQEGGHINQHPPPVEGGQDHITHPNISNPQEGGHTTW